MPDTTGRKLAAQMVLAVDPDAWASEFGESFTPGVLEDYLVEVLSVCRGASAGALVLTALQVRNGKA